MFDLKAAQGLEPCGQSYKQFTIVIYESSHNMGNFLVRYPSRVVIYDRRAVIRLATCLEVMGDDSCLRGCGFESQHCILDGHDIFSH